MSTDRQERQRVRRARAIAEAGGLDRALQKGSLPRFNDLTLSEAVILGLLRQEVRTFVGVFGHGSTEIGEVLRIYEQEGLVKMFNVRHETAASHAATALRWVTGQKAAVLTSIGPGALHALAGSLVPASDGVGVWYLFGDETTEDEGFNMQQIPKHEQGLFLRLCATMGEAYSLHTPWAVGTALRRGLLRVDHPYRAGPFYLLLPMNTQPVVMPRFNLDELPGGSPPPPAAASDPALYSAAVDAIRSTRRIVVRVGGGSRGAGAEIAEFLERADAVAVLSPLVTGILPYDHPRNMLIAGTKGSICGNYAMEHADLIVALGTRSVCQSDCSRTGFLSAKKIISINADYHDALHYSHTIALVGDVAATLRRLNRLLKRQGLGGGPAERPTSRWLAACTRQRRRWERYKARRFAVPVLYDEVWGQEVLTQPAAIKAATDWARRNNVVTFFDAGDVQAHGFQIVEDDRLGRTYSETGSSYMGFAVSALLATAMASRSFYGLALTGDGSFTMNPQILIDGAFHGASGCILLLDNRRMGAITGLQYAQYRAEYATQDTAEVDYLAWARSIKGIQALHGGTSVESLLEALESALRHKGLSLVYVPVYYGPDPLGGIAAFGRWNVGTWADRTQALRHSLGL